MAATLPPDLFPKVTQLLQPHMVDADEREAWLTQAFYLKEPRLYQMDRVGIGNGVYDALRADTDGIRLLHRARA